MCLFLETLSSRVLEFEGKVRANLIGAPFRYVRLDWKVIASYKHSSLFGLIVSDEGKKFYNIDTWCQSYETHFRCC